MSDLGTYTFLSWLRRGMATQIQRVDGAAAAPALRSAVSVGVSFNSGGLKARDVELALFGPGDIAGFEPQSVLRTWPAPDVFEAEPNYFPILEFSQPDLPWRYTPAAADATSDHLRPWLCLVALQDDEFKLEPSAEQDRLPVLRTDVSKLPPLAESWAWAHVQAIGLPAVSTTTVQDLLRTRPQQAIARLLCPRRLKPRTSYTCFLVPTFEPGRRAGLRQKQEATLDGLAPAWSGTSGACELPVYYAWRFATGGGGDFESLVRRLQPRVMDRQAGFRDMDVGQPGAGLPASSTTPLALPGALQSAAATPSAWADDEREAWIEALARLLNLSSDRLRKATEDRRLVPPLYGRWHAGQDELPLPGAELPSWFAELNSDPRLRVAAGLGALVVQDQREALLAGAWDQVERIRALNDELRFAQLAREAALSVYERHTQPMGVDDLLLVSSAVHARVRGPGGSVEGELAASPVPAGLFDASWRRASRRRGAIGRLQGRATAPPPGDLLDRLNEGTLSPAPPPLPPPAIQPPRDVMLPDGRIPPAGSLPGTYRPYEPPYTRGGPWDWFPPAGSPVHSDLPPVRPGQMPFPDAVNPALDKIQTAPAPDVRVKADLDRIRDDILTSLDPRSTIEKPLRQRIRCDPDWQPEDPIEPILAAPEFPQPMYEPLRDLSQDWLFPGLETIPPNTIGLLETNAKFVEAYLVGLNYEMARALLFAEYPTDQRGSYFRQFWDVRGYLGDLPADALKDIKAIHTWAKGGGLGANSPRSRTSQLVLFVRGDLFHRYPNTIVYAAKAKWDAPGGTRSLDPSEDAELHPLFSGTMKPDVAFFGFELSEADAVGSDKDPGWFFVLQEQPTQPRFGLAHAEHAVASSAAAPPALSWGHFAKTDADLEAMGYLSFQDPLPAIDTPHPAKWPGSRASDIAFVTLRRPYRVAVHASEMLNPVLDGE